MNFTSIPDSGNLHSMAYDAKSKELYVRYACKSCKKTGIKKIGTPRGSEGEPDGNDCPDCKGSGFASTYSYAGIPLETVQKIRAAPSSGSALHQYVIRNIQGVKL